MAYLHGVYPTEKSETAVSLSTTTQVQVVIGTAPIHMLDNPSEAVKSLYFAKAKRIVIKRLVIQPIFQNTHCVNQCCIVL